MKKKPGKTGLFYSQINVFDPCFRIRQVKSILRVRSRIEGSGRQINFTCLLFGYRHFFSRITYYMLLTAFHHAVMWHASRPWGAHSFFHPLGAAKITVHSRVTLLHHHFMTEPGLILTAMVFHPANTTSDKTDEQDESHHYKEPGDKSKEFAGHILPGFCK